MIFDFERNNGLWKHSQEFYSEEELVKHYKDFHLGEITGGRILPECLVVYREMSERISAIRGEYLNRQKERDEFFASRSSN